MDDADLATLKGQILVVNDDGSRPPPDSAKVYLLYYLGAMGKKTAAVAYNQAQLKVLRDIQKERAKSKQPPPRRTQDQINAEDARIYLLSVDQALTAAAAWAEKNKTIWQMKTVAADAKGFWSQDRLIPGHYKIVVRGMLGDLDAEWEGDMDVYSGQTVIMPPTPARSSRRITK